MYEFKIPDQGSSTVVPELKHLKKVVVGKRPVDQIGVLVHAKQLVVLSGKLIMPFLPYESSYEDTIVTVWPLPELSKALITLTAARTAHAFGIHSYLPAKNAKSTPDSEPQQTDLLVVGCRKKVVIYGAGKTFKDHWVSR